MDFSRNIEQMADLELTVRFEDVEDGWVMATVPELPGVITQGATIEEARENVLDALTMVLTTPTAPDSSSSPVHGVRIENLALNLAA